MSKRIRFRLTNIIRVHLVSMFAVFLVSACTDPHAPPSVSADVHPSDNKDDARIKSNAILGAPEHWEPAPEDGVELGFGWDSRKGRIVPNRCMSFSPIRSSGQTSQVSLSEVNDMSEVMTSLGVSASVSVNTIFASGSAAASFAKSSKVSAQSTTFLLDATVENGALFVGPRGNADHARLAYPSLEGDGEQLKKAVEPGRLGLQPWAAAMINQPADFRAYCGDAFVSAITSGARLYATISFSKTGTSKSSEVKTAIKGTYGPVTASGTTASKNSAALSNSNLSVKFLQVGGARSEIATTQAGLTAKLATLAADADDAPKFQSIRLTPYSQLGEWRGRDTWMETADEYEVIADYYWLLTSLTDEIDTIVNDYASYNSRTGKTKEELLLFQDDILQLRRLIYAAMQPITDNDTDATTTSNTNAKTAASIASTVSLFADRTSPPTSNGKTDTAEFIVPAFQTIDLNVVQRSPTLEQLADELRDGSPFGVPSLMRIYLPVPARVAPAKDEKNVDIVYSDETLQDAVIAWYVKPRAKRACDRDPTDSECLSNADLKSLKTLIPTR